MAWYNSLNDLRGDVGKVASNPLVDAGIGAFLSPAAAAAIAGLGKAITPGTNIGQDLGAGLTGGLAGIGGAGIGNALGGTISAAGKIGAALPGVSAVANAAGSSGGGSGTPGQSILDLVKQFGPTALGVAQGLNAANRQKQAINFANQAQGAVQSSYDQRAPLRAAGIAGLLNPQYSDVSGLLQHSGNPFAKTLPPMATGTRVGSTAATPAVAAPPAPSAPLTTPPVQAAQQVAALTPPPGPLPVGPLQPVGAIGKPTTNLDEDGNPLLPGVRAV